MDKILYFDCYSGISGDMTIGALLALGIDKDEFLQKLKDIKISGYRVKIQEKMVNGIKGTDFDVILDKSHSLYDKKRGKNHHRNLKDINQIIDKANIKDEAKALSKTIFNKIAVSEAIIHGKSINQVCFHEVGAIDSIVDIIGSAVCISMLTPAKIYSSPLHLGSGTIDCAHGTIPIPSPATLEILKNAPVYSTGVKGELVTPTGAAIIKSLVDEFIPIPQMTIEKIGYGTGKKEYEIPNALRVILGFEMTSSYHKSEKLMILETNIDDMNPEIYSYLLPLLLKKGALDVYLTNIIMKNGRPGGRGSALCNLEGSQALEETIFKETTTLGIRKRLVDRSCLERKTITLNSPFGKVRAKAAYQDGKILRISPEYEECEKIAKKTKMALGEVYNLLVKRSFDQ